MVVASIKQAFAILVVLLNLSSAVLGSPMFPSSSSMARHIATSDIVPDDPVKTNLNFDVLVSNALGAANVAQGAARAHFKAMDDDILRLGSLSGPLYKGKYICPSYDQEKSKIGHPARAASLEAYRQHYTNQDPDRDRKRKAEIHKGINEFIPRYAALVPWNMNHKVAFKDSTNRHLLTQLDKEFREYKQDHAILPIVLDDK